MPDEALPEVQLSISRRRLAAQIAEMISEADPELGDIVADLTRLYRATIPVYDRVDAASIERNTGAALRIVVRQLRAGTAQADFGELAALARIWAEQEIPLELVAHSIQLGARRIFELIRRRATAAALPAATIDQMQDLAWEWATASATAVHMVLQERAVATATHRADFLRRLLERALSPAALAAQAPNHRLDPTHRYWLACADWRGSSRDSDLLAALRVRGATATLPVVDTVLDQHLIALLPQSPEHFDPQQPVALGPALPLSSAHLSYRHAQRTLALATRFGRSGLLDLGALGPLPLLDGARASAQVLYDRHLAVLREHGDTGIEITETVRTFLGCDRRIDDTAAALFVHRNTVRNRLTRFRELTGLDLDRTDDLIVAWWLLHRDEHLGDADDAYGINV